MARVVYDGYGSKEIDFSPLAKLGEVYDRAKISGARSGLAGMGNEPPDNISKLLFGAGELEGGMMFAKLADSRSQRALAQGNADRLHAIQQQELALKQRALEEGRLPAGFARNPTGGLQPVPGGPADPTYLQSVTAAKEKPSDAMEPEQKLRKEFETAAKPHLEVRRGFERVLASKDDAAGDIALIFGFMKMLDPGSVVREGEFATAQNAASVPDQVRNMYNRALEGTRLNPDQRTMFKGQAQSLYGASSKEYGARTEQFRGIAQKYNLDPSRVIPSLGPEPQGPPVAPVPGARQATDGNWYVADPKRPGKYLQVR